MVCPQCRSRKARRSCPGVGAQICTICCGTKRLVEIACPASCLYLTSSQRHPAAVVKRQQDRDVAVLMTALGPLSEQELQVFFVVHTFISRFKAAGSPLTDQDVADAVSALATEYETASRGVVYEPAATAPQAETLRRELKAFLLEIAGKGGSTVERMMAVVLRGIARGARHEAPGIGDGAVDYLSLVARLLNERPRDAAAAGSGIILP